MLLVSGYYEPSKDLQPAYLEVEFECNGQTYPFKFLTHEIDGGKPCYFLEISHPTEDDLTLLVDCAVIPEMVDELNLRYQEIKATSLNKNVLKPHRGDEGEKGISVPQNNLNAVATP